jgi:hypothetical protein
MKPYLFNLQSELYSPRYYILEVSNAIKWAILDKEVKKHKEVIKRLKELSIEMEKYPIIGYNTKDDIDHRVFNEVNDIKNEAYELVCEL